jgi:hypothetical protein
MVNLQRIKRSVSSVRPTTVRGVETLLLFGARRVIHDLKNA